MRRPARGRAVPRCTRPKPADGGRSRPACARSSSVASIPTRADAIDADWSSPKTSTAGAPTGRCLYVRAVLGSDRAAVAAAAAAGRSSPRPYRSPHPGHDSRRTGEVAANAASPRRCTRSAGSGTTPRREPTASRGRTPRACSQADDSHVETAARALKEYDVLGPDDWRRRDDVRALPEADREDLEVWLMEQVYLYCRALADRPESPKDWSRAVKILDHVSGPGPIPAFAALRHRLNGRPGTEGVSFASALGQSRPLAREPSWVNEYLLGVVAECELESDDQATARDRRSYATRRNRTAEPWSAILEIAPGARPSGRSPTTTSSWSLIPIHSGDITARRPSRMAWAVEPTSPTPPVTWRTVSSRRPEQPDASSSPRRQLDGARSAS